MERDEYLIEGTLSLERSEQLRIVDGRDLLIHLWRGSLWITQERDQRDVVLEAGQCFRLDRNGTAFVKCWDDAVLALTSPHENRPARAIELHAAPRRASNLRPKAPFGRLMPHVA
ncbi:MAG TPA: DUF2917 domain-containing protein [Casimicrobiaceae bacterium]|nr:DUF2917 domain-containing protein [Casimicrobiaceae bacterium]